MGAARTASTGSSHSSAIQGDAKQFRRAVTSASLWADERSGVACAGGLCHSTVRKLASGVAGTEYIVPRDTFTSDAPARIAPGGGARTLSGSSPRLKIGRASGRDREEAKG